MTRDRITNNAAPLVIAHRGASACAPENTIPAIELAISMGVDAIEVDIQLTKDHQLVVYHDASLGRTTPGKGRVRALTLEELKRLDAGKHFGPEYLGISIPTLIEIFDVIGSRILINIELKCSRKDVGQLVDATIRQLRALGYWESVLISSFNPLALIRTARIEPSIKLGLLLSRQTPQILCRLLHFVIPHTHTHMENKMVNENEIDREHRQRKAVIAWTINSKERILQLIQMGVDGIITDRPDMVRSCVGLRQGNPRW